mgnify:FL=1
MAKYSNLTLGQIEAIVNKIVMVGGPEGVKRLLADELAVVEVAPDTVYVDYSVRPNYPSWMSEVMHPELEATGHYKFETESLQLWLHPSQIAGGVTGQVIYNHLFRSNLLESCLGLRDLEEIQKKGFAHFRKHFRGKTVFGWKSVVHDSGDRLYVPWLVMDEGEVLLGWNWLGCTWHPGNPALRFADSK